MKRREFLVGSIAAIGTSIAKPALALPALMPSLSPELRKWKEYLLEEQAPHYANGDQFLTDVIRKINGGLIDKHTYLFNNKPMFDVTELREIDGYQFPITAKSRALRAEYHFEYINDRVVSPEQLMNVIIEECAAEFRKFQENGGQWAFYIPVIPVRATNSKNFAPMLGFKTRYADVRYPYVPFPYIQFPEKGFV